MFNLGILTANAVGSEEINKSDTIITKSNISRLESANSKIMPNISTLIEYAAAIGYDMRIVTPLLKKITKFFIC